MRLIFKHIDIHGFMSFDDASFDFSSQSGMVLVTGKNNDIPDLKNGSGKTTLFNSLIYTLFGQLQNKIKNENIVNRYIDDKDMRLVLTFAADGIDYTVIRGLAKGKSSYLELKRGDENITKSTIGETQEFLEKEILMCDISIFLRTIMLSSDQTYNFYMLKKSDKKDFVEKLFDISVFGDMYQSIHKDILNMDKDIMSRQNRLIILNRNNGEYSDRILKYDEDKNNAIARLKSESDELSFKYNELKKLNETKKENEIKKLESAAEKIKNSKLKIDTSVLESERKIKELDISIGKLLSLKDAKQTVIDKHSELMSKLCEDCQSIFGDYYKINQYKKEITEIDVKLSEYVKSKQAHIETRDSFTAKRADLVAALDTIEKHMRQITENAVKKEKQLLLLESKILTLNAGIKNKKTEVNPYIDLYEKNKESIEIETRELKNISNKYNTLKFAETVVSQDTLRKFIISDLIGLLNNRIQKYLMKLGSKYTVVFDSDMDYEFITTGGSCEFQNFSAGERMRIMIATSFAFRDFMSIRNGLTSNILILDEYFDSAIDSTCVESILNILKDYIRDLNQNVYVISHRSEVSSDQFNHIIQVEKTNDISRINYLK